uniref:Uncharacterized protein n=1 Tax=Palpitomonas bilix TaxID=652834 RepID=A0A7S3CVL3_9EUKA|mmetsp:Transcript_1075/g.2283  ORF Transcript_1075/g.2283 Transcript_1075/m.2283 type:complete len:129 (+) Transcript_1075:242-628(+)
MVQDEYTSVIVPPAATPIPLVALACVKCSNRTDVVSSKVRKDIGKNAVDVLHQQETSRVHATTTNRILCIGVQYVNACEGVGERKNMSDHPKVAFIIHERGLFSMLRAPQKNIEHSYDISTLYPSTIQ